MILVHPVMVRSHAGQPFDSSLAPLGLRSWQAIRCEAGVECPELAEGLSKVLDRSWRAIRCEAGVEWLSRLLPIMLDEINCPDPVEGHAFVYILQSEDSLFYVGQASDVRERLRKHRLGRGSKHPHDHPKIRLVYVEGAFLPIEAVRRERQLKGWSRAKKVALISGDVSTLKKLSRAKKEALVSGELSVLKSPSRPND